MALLHVCRGTIQPDSETDPGNTHSNIWSYQSSQTTKVVSSPYHARTIAWGAGELYEGRDLWVLYSFRPISSRDPYVMLNIHNHPSYGGWLDEPHRATGVSAWFISWRPSRGLCLESNAHNWTANQILTNAQMETAEANGDWIDLVIYCNIQTTTTGALKVWLNGAETPVLDLQNYRTAWELNNGLGPQTAYSMWSGMYNDQSQNMTQNETMEWVTPRVGRTFDEALQDGVDWAITEEGLTGSYVTADPSIHYLHESFTRDSSLFLYPASLGTDPPPDPPLTTLPETVHGWGDRTASGAVEGACGFNSKRASLYTAPDTRDITSIWSYQRCSGTSGTVNQRFFISTSDGGSPANPTTTLVTCSPVAATAPEVPAWVEIPLPAPFRWEAGQSYFAGFQTDSGSGDATVEIHTVTADGERFVFASDTYADGLASPFGTPGDSSSRRIILFFEGELVSPSDPDPPAEIYRLTALSRSGTRDVASGHSGGIDVGGGL